MIIVGHQFSLYLCLCAQSDCYFAADVLAYEVQRSIIVLHFDLFNINCIQCCRCLKLLFQGSKNYMRLNYDDRLILFQIMRIIINIIAVFVFILTVSSWEGKDKRPNINPLNTQFTGILALRWPAAYCQHLSLQQSINCKAEKMDLWDSTSFTIGGFWTSSKTTKQFQDFNLHYVEYDLSVTDRLHNFWPKLYHQDPQLSEQLQAHSLWQQQWETYGKDYAHVISTLFPDQMELQRDYFKDAMSLYQRKFGNCKKLAKSTILHPQHNFILEKHQFVNLLQIKEDHFKLKCIDGTNMLYQIEICLVFSEDGTFSTPCTKVEKESRMALKSNCPDQVQLSGYATNEDKYGRVFSYKQFESNPPPSHLQL